MKLFLSNLIATAKQWLSSFFNKEKILTYLKTKAVEKSLVKILGSSLLGGFRTWFITFLVENLFDKYVEPIIEKGLRKQGLIYNKINGRVQIKRLNNIDQKEDEDAYDDTVTDILS